MVENSRSPLDIEIAFQRLRAASWKMYVVLVVGFFFMVWVALVIAGGRRGKAITTDDLLLAHHTMFWAGPALLASLGMASLVLDWFLARALDDRYDDYVAWTHSRTGFSLLRIRRLFAFATLAASFVMIVRGFSEAVILHSATIEFRTFGKSPTIRTYEEIKALRIVDLKPKGRSRKLALEVEFSDGSLWHPEQQAVPTLAHFSKLMKRLTAKTHLKVAGLTPESERP